MRIYFSGIGGVGIGPLALIAKDMGHDVLGSDAQASRYTEQMQEHGIKVFIGQSGAEIARAHAESPIGWFVGTSALPVDHPELQFAKQEGIRFSKRDELLNELIRLKELKLIAIAGTHGKTTTTGMMIWLLKELGLPLSYSVGTRLSFGPNGVYEEGSEYFIYEADEFDRNFLHFQPYHAIIPSVDYDHSDTYPDRQDYINAFYAFLGQSHCGFLWQNDADYLGDIPTGCVHTFPATEDVSRFTLPGEHNRRNAFLVLQSAAQLLPNHTQDKMVEILNRFPGTERRFEKIKDNLYTDYAHHPTEIKAVIQLARELKDSIVVIYQPHQNVRQHEIRDLYADCFSGAQQVYWLPTYLSRENPNLPVLAPRQLIAHLDNPSIVEEAAMDEKLVETIRNYLNQDVMVLALSAGDLDQWLRDNFSET